MPTENLAQSLDYYSVCREAGGIYFLTSPVFMIMLIVLVFTVPFAAIGIYSLWMRVKNYMRTRDGWIRVRKKLSNYHWLTFWARPTGRKIKIKGEEGFEFEIPIQTEGGMMALEKEYNVPPQEKSKLPVEKPVKKDEKPKLTPEQKGALKELLKE